MKFLHFIAVVLIYVPQLVYIFQDGSTVVVQGNNTTGLKDCTAGNYLYCNACIPCENGTYQPESNTNECIACCYGSTTLTPGSKSVEDCVCIAGFYDTGDVCKPCSMGYYQDQVNKSKCEPCQFGHTTNMTASTSQMDCYPCSAGHYLNTATMVCEPCGFDLYQPNPATTKCTPCPAKTKTIQTTSTSLQQCITICQCSSNATCLINGRTSQCVCKDYYSGNGQFCTHQCDLGYCQNGCKCVVTVAGSPYCLGKDGYTGTKCESKTDDTGNVWITGVVFGLLLLLALVFTIFFCCLFRGRNGFKMKVCRCTFAHIPCENKTKLVTQPQQPPIVARNPCNDVSVITRPSYIQQQRPCTKTIRYY